MIPYSPEYRASGTDIPLLAELARITGGDELAEPVAAFIHDLEATAKAREIWQPLLLLVALLFPLDVAIRRVMLGRSDFDKATTWVRARLPWLKGSGLRMGETEKQMGELFAARERARQRQSRGPKESSEVQVNGDDNNLEINEQSRESESRSSGEIVSPEAPEKPSSPDTLSRLKDAKKRARREE